MPIASNMPVPVSPKVGPALHGRPSRSPVIAMVPPQAWAIMSKARLLLVRAAAAEAFDLAIDQPRMQRVHDLPAEPQPLDRAGREILDKDVGAPRHLLDQREAPLGFQIDRDRFLVGVVDHEVIRVRAGRRPAAERAPGLAGLRIFDFDNLRAEPGQRFGAGRAGFELGQVENADALETVRLYSIHRLVLLYKNVDPTIEQTGFRLNRIDRPLGSQARR